MKRIILLFFLLCPSAFASIPYVISPLSDGTAVVSISNRATLYVDPNGNDSTAKRGILDRPWATLIAAKNAALQGDLINVMAGTYTTRSNLLANGVHWYFSPGAVVQGYFTNSTISIFDDSALGANGAVTSSISGNGTFIYQDWTDTDSAIPFGVLLVTNANSLVSFQAKAAISMNGNDTGLAVIGVRGGTVYVEVQDTISATNSSGFNTGVYWGAGDVYLRCPEIKTESGYTIWGHEPANGASNNLYVSSQFIYGKFYSAVAMEGITKNWKAWIDCDGEIRTDDPGGLTLGTISLIGSGKVYVRAQKVSMATSQTTVSGFKNALYGSGGELWVQADKISSVDKFGVFSGGTNWVRALQYEHNPTNANGSSASGNGFLLSGGENTIQGGRIKMQNGRGILHSGGTSYLQGLVIDTSQNNFSTNYSIQTTASGCNVQLCELIYPALASGISGGINGTWFDRTGNSFYIDTNSIYTGNGSSISNLNASSLASGTVPAARFGSTTVPLSALSQSAAASGQVAEWNGVSWVPADVQGVTIPNTITPTNFILNQKYTNNSGSVQLVDITVSLSTAVVAGQASLSLYADQTGGNTFVNQDQAKITTLASAALTDTRNLIGALSNNAAYYFTNDSTGSGNSSAIVSGSGELITLGDGAAANLSLTYEVHVAQLTNLVYGSNVVYYTNAATMAPNFTKPYTLIQTNAAFTILAPIGVEATKTLAQTTVFQVTNSTAAAVVITPPANCHVQGTWYVTNWTTITFFTYGGNMTNAISLPLW